MLFLFFPHFSMWCVTLQITRWPEITSEGDRNMSWSVTILWGGSQRPTLVSSQGHWRSMSAAPGAGSCWCRSGTRSSWGNPSASGRWGSGASWAGAWCPAACWGAGGAGPATGQTRGACGRGRPCGGVATSPPRCEARAWCGDPRGADSLHGDQTRAGAGDWPAPSLAGCAGLRARSESRVLPFRLEIPPRRRVWASRPAEADPAGPWPGCGLYRPSSASCTWIAYFETRSSPEIKERD